MTNSCKSCLSLSDFCLDNTKRSTYDTCPRKFFYQHILGLQPERGSTALRFGTTWHGFLEGYYRHIQEHGWKEDGLAIHAAMTKAQEEWNKETAHQLFLDDYRTFEECAKLFISYLEFYNLDKGMLDIIQTEQVFRQPLALSEEERERFPHLLDSVFFTGKIDLRVKLNGMTWLMEHKSTSAQPSLQATRLNRSAQIQGYSWVSGEAFSTKPEGVLISFASLSCRKTKDGGYGKATQAFLRHPQIFTKKDYQNWRTSFLSTANQIAEDMTKNTWPMRQDNCYQYGQCSYSILCDQANDLFNLNTSGFIFKPWNVEKED
jgi:hypothetical protein